MTRAISALLRKCAEAASDGGPVPTDLALQLAAEGYDLNRLDRDVEALLTKMS
jgi:hypothetical protein